MSLVKLASLQIGKSGTASNNFHWRNLLDGVLRLTRGNAGAPIADVMLVNADNSVSFPGNVASGVLGAGQTWQNVTASRAIGTTYTNSTGKPVFIMVTTNAVNNVTITLTIDGAARSSMGIGSNIPLSPNVAAVIPNGSTYSVAASSAILTWSELR